MTAPEICTWPSCGCTAKGQFCQAPAVRTYTRTPDPLLAEMAEALRAAKEAWIAYETARTTQDHHAAVARIRFALGIEELEND